MRKRQEERVAEFLEAVRAGSGQSEADTAQLIVDWAHQQDLWDWFPGDADSPLYYKPAMGDLDWEPTILGVDPRNGNVYVQGADFRRRQPFSQEEAYAQFLEQLYAISGVQQTPKGDYPHISLATLADADTRTQFLDLMSSVITRIGKLHPTPRS